MRIHYFGHVLHATGYGRAARDLCLALTLAGHRLAITALGGEATEIATHLRDEHLPLASLLVPMRAALSWDDPVDAIIVHTLPLSCATVMHELLAAGADPQVPMIAYTTWEAETWPAAVVSALADFNQVWVPCEWNRSTLEMPLREARGRALRATIRVVPHGADPARIRALRALGEQRAPHQPGNEYRFIWTGAWTARKNPRGLLRAYAHGFGAMHRDGDVRPHLHLHSSGTDPQAIAQSLGELGSDQAALPPLRFTNHHLSDAELDREIAAADCFVTASCGEAWNYGAWDAVCAGKPVLASFVGAALAYMRLVPTSQSIDAPAAPARVDAVWAADGSSAACHQVTMVGAQGLTSFDTWLEPNLVELGSAMRALASGGFGEHIPAPVETLVNHFGLPRIGEIATSHLQEIRP